METAVAAVYAIIFFVFGCLYFGPPRLGCGPWISVCLWLISGCWIGKIIHLNWSL